MADAKKARQKDGARRRTAGGRGGGMPRIMWLAIVVCIAGAVFLFRTQSSDVPTGIGENQTMVTAPDVETTLDQEAPPRSGDVDISSAGQTLTPEQVAANDAEAQAKADELKAAAEQAARDKAAAAKKAAAEEAARQAAQASSTVQNAPEPIMPQASGPYVVQIGSFGKAENADGEAGRLKQKGWDARVKVGNTSDGSIIYRVRIGYFKSRTEAEAFIKQNRKAMRGAIAVHR